MFKWRFSRGTRALLLVAVVFAFAVSLWWFGFHGLRPDLILWPPADDDAIFERLAEPTSFEARDEPIASVLRRLSRQSGVPLDLDAAELARVVPRGPYTVSGRYRNWPLEGVLEDLVGQLDPELRLGVGQERVQITTETAWHAGLNHYVSRIHRLDRLMKGAGQEWSPERLSVVVASVVAPGKWTGAGGLGDIRAVPGGMLVSQTPRQQRTIAALLDSLADLRETPDGETAPVESRRTPAFWIDPPDTAETDAVRAALDRRLDLELDGVPLDEALEGWSGALHIPIHLDRAALGREAFDPHTPLTARLGDIRFDDALQLLVAEPHGLSCLVRHGRLWITTRNAARRHFSLRLYPVADLQATSLVGETLVQCLTYSTATGSWRAGGGDATIAALPGALLIRQTAAGHAEVERLLGAIRHVVRPGPGRPADSAEGAPASSIERVLREPVTWDLTGVRLDQVVRELREKHRINVWINDAALADAGLAPGLIVNLQADRESLATCLDRMLAPAQLKYAVRHETLVFTTPEEAAESLEMRCHDIARLMGPVAAMTEADSDAVEGARLAELIEGLVAPGGWPMRNGPGLLRAYGDFLPVSQSFEVQQEIGDLLIALKQDTADGRSTRGRTIGPPGEAYPGAARALAEPANLVFEQTPFSHVLRAFEQAIGMPLECSSEAQAQAGISSNTPVTGDYRERDLAAALRTVLAPWGLAPSLDGRRIRIDMEPDPLLRVHPLGSWADDELLAEHLSQLPRVIQLTSSGRWARTGPVGVCQVFRRSLVVRQTLLEQLALDRQLDEMRQFLLADTPPSTEWSLPAPATRGCWKALEQPVDLLADDAPLEDVVERLSEQLPVALRVAPALRAQWKKTPPSAVTMLAVNAPAGDVLESLLHGRDMDCSLSDDHWTLLPAGTASKPSSARPVARLYHIADLDHALRPPDAEVATVPLPWYLQPVASPYGRLPLTPARRAGKEGADRTDPLLEILRHSADSDPSGFGQRRRCAVLRLGPAVLVVQPADVQWRVARTIGTLRQRFTVPPAPTAPPTTEPRVSLQAERLPRHEVLRRLAEQSGEPWLIEAAALGEGKARLTELLSPRIDATPVGRAIREPLAEPDSARCLRRGTTRILTGRVEADRTWVWQVLNVRDLAGRYGPHGELLLAQWASNLAPFSWRTDARTTLCCLPGWIAAHHQRSTLARIGELFDALRDDPDSSSVKLTFGARQEVRVRLEFADKAAGAAAVARWIRADRDRSVPADSDAAMLILSRLETPLPAALDWLSLETWSLAEQPQPDEERLFLLCEGVKNYGDAVDDVVEPLKALLERSTDREHRDQLIGGLAACGSKATDALIELARSGTAEDQTALVRSLRRGGLSAPDAVPILLRLLIALEPTPVLEAIAEVDPTGRESHRVIELWSRDSDVGTRYRAEEVRPLIEAVFGAPRRGVSEQPSTGILNLPD